MGLLKWRKGKNDKGDGARLPTRRIGYNIWISLTFHVSETDPIKYFTFSMIISILGIRGILLNRRNIPIMSMPIESMLLAVNSNFLVFSVSSDDIMGQ